MQQQPTPQQYRRRRIAAGGLAALAIAGAAGVGVSLQKATGWSADDWERHTSVQEPADYEDTPAKAVPRIEVAEQPDIAPVARQASGSPALQDAPKPGGSGRVSLTSEDVQRRAYLQVPDAAREGKPIPVVLAFHGYRESPQAMAEYSGLGDAWEGAIVAYPEGLGEAWEGAPYAKTAPGQDVQFVRDLLDALSATYSIDATRVYAAGMSNGGGFAAKLACEMPQEFTAIASVSGAYYPDTWRSCATKQSRASDPASIEFTRGRTVVPFLEIHGRKDETIAYDGGERHGAPYMSAMRLSSLFASRMGCFGAPTSIAVTDKVTRVEWPGCREDSEVMHLAIGDGGHTWPGELKGEAGAGEVEGGSARDHHNRSDRTTRVITATNEALAFFERHRRVLG